MKKITVKIDDVIEKFFTTATPPLIPDESIFNFNPFFSFLRSDCLGYEIDLCMFNDEYTTIDICNEIIKTWNEYIQFNRNEITRFENALTANYNILDNYSMLETTLNAETLSNIDNKNTITGKIENNTTGDKNNNFNEIQTSPYNNEDLRIKDKTFFNVDTTTTTEYKNGYENKTSTEYKTTTTKTIDDIEITGNNVTENVVKRVGNIGVQTSTDMIEKELILRGRQYAKKIFNTWKNMYLYLMV